MSIDYYFKEIRRRLNQKRFTREAAGVLQLPPVATGTPGGPIVLSMVHHRDVLPYLLALQSFARHIRPAQVVVIADPTLDAADQSILREKVPGIDIRPALDYRHPELPVGGTWERLHAITQFCQHGYTVQLDADTFATGPLDHVADCIARKRAFTLGTFDLQAPVAVSEVARWAQSHCDTHPNPHVQLLCEAQLLTATNGDASQHYIRGCSGFSGWPQGATHPGALIALSQRMRSALGAAWDKWGTEQFASNVLVSCQPGGTALPHPVYTTPDQINHTTRFVHFIGYLRYDKGIYLQILRKHLVHQQHEV